MTSGACLCGALESEVEGAGTSGSFVARTGPLSSFSKCIAIAAGVLLCAACIVRGTPPPLDLKPVPDGPPLIETLPLPGFRLLPEVRPVHYELELELDPGSQRFRGRVSIQIVVSSPSDQILLHAEALDLDSVRVATVRGDQIPRVATAGAGRIALLLPQPLSGDATLRFSFRGSFGQGPLGLYRVARNGRVGVYSNFEPTGARRAFPCFDEPGFKTPFDVTLKVPHVERALANAPVISRSVESTSDVVRFAATPPLPTYLVAFGVGSFEALAAPVAGLQHQILTFPGESERARYAAEQTPPVLEALTRYLGRPYPFAKLDQLVLPELDAGAMENPGLVMYQDFILLLDADAGKHRRAVLQNTIAHELAHMWFGDQVTLRWWDDLWLNESFASWLATRIQTEIAPEAEMSLVELASRLRMLDRDALPSARSVRSTVDSPEAIANAFDDLAVVYDKGGALLSMLEAWLGEQTFQSALQTYLERHAGSSVTTSDLGNALAEKAPGRPVAKVLEAFLREPGAPLLSLEVRCSGTRVNVHYTETRYTAPRTTSVEASAAAPWSVPVCLHLFAADKQQTVCSVLEPPAGDTPLDVNFCPEFFHPNASELGYYQWQLAPGQLANLARQRVRLNLRERVALPLRALAAFEAGAVSAQVLLEVLWACALDDHSAVLDSVLVALSRLERAWPPNADRQPLARWAHALLLPHLQRLGYYSRPGESRADQAVRPTLLRAVFELGGDADVRAAASQLAQRLLADPGSVDGKDAWALLPIVAGAGDAAFFSALQQLLESGPPHALRAAVVQALGSFDDPQLLRQSLDLWLAGRVRWSDSSALLNAAGSSERRLQTWWSWYLAHADATLQRLGGDAKWLLQVFALECTPAGQAAARAHFSDPRFAAPTQRALALALEQAERCWAVRESRGPALAASLK